MQLTTCQFCSQSFEADFGLAACPHCGQMQLLSEEGTAAGGAEQPVQSPEWIPVTELQPEASPATAEAGVDNVENIKNIENIENVKNIENVSVDPFAEIADYGNSDLSSASSGGFLYDLLIDGIDSREVRLQLEEALNERRLALNIPAVLSQVHMGQLKLERLSAVKASLIVQRIITFPLRISWVQHAVVEL